MLEIESKREEESERGVGDKQERERRERRVERRCDTPGRKSQASTTLP